MVAEQNHSERKMNKCGVTLNAAIPPCNHAFELVKPGERPLNLPPSFVSTQWATVLAGRLDPVLAVWRNQFNAALCQLLIERITVVGAIPNKSLGSSHGDGFIEGSFDKGDFMWASRSRVHGEWKTMSVSNNHELRTLAPLGLSHFGSPFFATTKVPSMKHSERSIRPVSSRCRARLSKICRITPDLTQRVKRLKQVHPEGKRSGRSAQAAPVRKTHRMPLSTARSLCNCGLPRPSARRTGVGISGSRMAHCSSVSSSLRAMAKTSACRKKALTTYL
jgi:hypothetical protein